MVVRRGLAADWVATAWTTGADGGFPDVTDDSPQVDRGDAPGPDGSRLLASDLVAGRWRVDPTPQRCHPGHDEGSEEHGVDHLGEHEAGHPFPRDPRVRHQPADEGEGQDRGPGEEAGATVRNGERSRSPPSSPAK